MGEAGVRGANGICGLTVESLFHNQSMKRVSTSQE